MLLRRCCPNRPTADPLDAWHRVAFASNRSGNWDIYSMRADSSELRQLTADPALDRRPRQSPADGTVAFVSDRNGNFDIYTVAADGCDLRRLTADPADDNYPNWSPDGKRIVFASNRAGSWDLYVMNADGTGVAPLTSGPDDDSGPAWSPDGKVIAFVRGPENARQIWVVNSDGSSPEPVSNAVRRAENLVWTTEARTLALDFDATGDGFTQPATLQYFNGYPYQYPAPGNAVPLTDVQMNDSLEDRRTLRTYVKYTGADKKQIADAYLVRYPFDSGQEQRLPGVGLNMDGDWQNSDFIPPTTALSVPPLAPSGGVELTVTASDEGGSGPYAYEVQLQRGGGPWEGSGRIYFPTLSFSGGAGETVAMRVRGIDRAGNAEPWPSGPDGNGTITFYQSRYYGRIFDVRETPIPGVRVLGPTRPDISFYAAADGSYDAYSFDNISTLSVSDSAYGKLPSADMGTDKGYAFDMALPPKANAVQNGGFEDGLAGWEANKPAMVMLAMGPGPAHSGVNGLQLGRSVHSPQTTSVKQTLTVPAAEGRPTLSFFMRPDLSYNPQITNLTVTITPAGGASAAVTLHRSTAQLWTHAWADLSAWGGQTVTLSFDLAQQGDDGIVLDEIVVGEWRTPVITSASGPGGMTGKVTIKGENFELGATVRLDTTALATAYVDASTLTAELPAGVKPGSRALWVTNPGGEEALTTLRVGLPGFLPLVD